MAEAAAAAPQTKKQKWIDRGNGIFTTHRSDYTLINQLDEKGVFHAHKLLHNVDLYMGKVGDKNLKQWTADGKLETQHYLSRQQAEFALGKRVAGAVRRRDAAAVAEAPRMERKRKAMQKPAAANKARRGAHSAQAGGQV